HDQVVLSYPVPCERGRHDGQERRPQGRGRRGRGRIRRQHGLPVADRSRGGGPSVATWRFSGPRLSSRQLPPAVHRLGGQDGPDWVTVRMRRDREREGPMASSVPATEGGRPLVVGPPVKPWRDRLATGLMLLAALGAVGAAIGAIGAVADAGPATRLVETWRL